MGVEELEAKVRAYLDRLPRKLRCPACDDHHWQLRTLDDAPAEGQMPRVITIMCTCCGHLTFFDSQGMGLV